MQSDHKDIMIEFVNGKHIMLTVNGDYDILSQASWGRLDMKPTRNF